MSKLHPFVPLMPGESVTSFCARLAALHGLSSVWTFSRYLGLRFSRIVAGDPTALGQLADLTAVPVDELARRSLRREGAIYSYQGEIAPQPMMRRSRMYVCPQCLLEDIAGSRFPPIAACYGRAAWQFRPIRACDLHGVLLQQFGRPLHRSIAHDFARTIGPLLHTLQRCADEAVAVPPSAAEAYLRARLDGSPRPSPLLDQMPWYAAARTCEAVGAVALFRASVTLAGLDENDRRRAAHAGFEIIDAGRRSVENLLDDLRYGLRSTGTGREGAPIVYGLLNELLTRPTPDPAYAPVREIVFRHALRMIPYGPGAVVVGLPVKRRQTHSLVTAAAAAQQHQTRLRKLLVAEGIIAADAPRRDADVLFDARLATPVLRRIAKGMSLHSVTEHLQTRYAHTLTLARSGFIKAIVASAGETDIRPRYAAFDLDDFIASLIEDAVVHPQPERPIMDIPRAAKRAYCTTPDVLRMILARQLRWVGLDPDVSGFHAILVNADEVLDHVRGPAHDGYTMQTLRVRLGVHQRVVEALIAQSHLPQVERINPVNHCPNRIVLPETVEAFERSYVSLSELAQHWRTNAFRLKKDLDRRGIEPALRNDQVGATFYSRRQLL